MHASVHVGVMAPEYNQAGKRVQRHCASLRASRACAAPALAHPRTTARKNELVLALTVALKRRVCALGGAYPRACAPPAAHISQVNDILLWGEPSKANAG